MYTLKQILDSGEIIDQVFENKNCFVFYTLGHNNQFRMDGDNSKIRWGLDKETNGVGDCSLFASLLRYTNGDPESLVEVDPQILKNYIDKPVHPKKVDSSLHDYEDDYI